jgi:cyclopropane-fatty-acyl-phospholipid synthase
VETLPLHYADTLREWRRRFMTNWDEAAALYDERFCRMWEFYLASSEVGFRHDRLAITHLQLSKHQDVVPRTRDYIRERCNRLRELEASAQV